MIGVRLITRTHYQVDEPAYLRELVLHCTSPVRSDYADRVAKRLTARISGHRDMNVAAAGYAVDLAKSVNLITENMLWTDQAHLLYALADEQASGGSEHDEFELTVQEKWFFFWAFLRADGAAFIYLARVLLESEALPPLGQSWNDLANGMLLEVCEEYLRFVVDVQARTRIRNILNRRHAKPYSGKSGAHQMFLHVQTLFRLGLLARTDKGNQREYRQPQRPALHLFLELVPNLKTLERAIEQDDWISLASKVYGSELERNAPGVAVSDKEMLDHVFGAYKKVLSTGVPLCPLVAVVESLRIEIASAGRPIPGVGDVMRALTEYQRAHPRDVRFHVDRYGHPAYLKLSS